MSVECVCGALKGPDGQIYMFVLKHGSLTAQCLRSSYVDVWYLIRNILRNTIQKYSCTFIH